VRHHLRGRGSRRNGVRGWRGAQPQRNRNVMLLYRVGPRPAASDHRKPGRSRPAGHEPLTPAPSGWDAATVRRARARVAGPRHVPHLAVAQRPDLISHLNCGFMLRSGSGPRARPTSFRAAGTGAPGRAGEVRMRAQASVTVHGRAAGDAPGAGRDVARGSWRVTARPGTGRRGISGGGAGERNQPQEDAFLSAKLPAFFA
jgi:hypothetical protein